MDSQSSTSLTTLVLVAAFNVMGAEAIQCYVGSTAFNVSLPETCPSLVSTCKLYNVTSSGKIVIGYSCGDLYATGNTCVSKWYTASPMCICNTDYCNTAQNAASISRASLDRIVGFGIVVSVARKILRWEDDFGASVLI